MTFLKDLCLVFLSHIFLFDCKLQELTSVKKQSPGLMSRMSDSMRNMASSWMLKTREPEFQEMAEYTKNFREKMLALETISDKIAKDRFGEKVHKFLLLFTCSSYFSLPSVSGEMVEGGADKRQLPLSFTSSFGLFLSGSCPLSTYSFSTHCIVEKLWIKQD